MSQSPVLLGQIHRAENIGVLWFQTFNCLANALAEIRWRCLGPANIEVLGDRREDTLLHRSMPVVINNPVSQNPVKPRACHRGIT
jgi:hypothetical protein